jgi:hypothetical protein
VVSTQSTTRYEYSLFFFFFFFWGKHQAKVCVEFNSSAEYERSRASMDDTDRDRTTGPQHEIRWQKRGMKDKGEGREGKAERKAGEGDVGPQGSRTGGRGAPFS